MKISRDAGACETVGWRIIQLVLLGIVFSTFSNLADAQPLPALRPPRGEITPTFWEQHGWQIVIVVVASIILVGIVIILLTLPKPKLTEPKEVLARRGFMALRGRAVDGALLVEVSGIFRRYVIFAFDLPPDELTTTELKDSLRYHSDENIPAAIDFLRQCDEGKFSPDGTPPNADPASRALELLEKIEIHRRRSLPEETVA